MRQLLPIFLSAVAICAFATTTPAVAQETITGAPRGTAPVTAEAPNTRSHGPRNDEGPFAALGAIFAAPFDEAPRRSTETTQPEMRCGVTLDCSQNDYRGVP
jgi:hypothetical protein